MCASHRNGWHATISGGEHCECAAALAAAGGRRGAQPGRLLAPRRLGRPAGAIQLLPAARKAVRTDRSGSQFARKTRCVPSGAVTDSRRVQSALNGTVATPHRTPDRAEQSSSQFTRTRSVLIVVAANSCTTQFMLSEAVANSQELCVH